MTYALKWPSKEAWSLQQYGAIGRRVSDEFKRVPLALIVM